jgi:plasmid stability protein
MKTLYLRNVPDEVVERLERLAAREATSVSALAVRELGEISRRADNLRLLSALDHHNIEPSELVKELDAERSKR